MNDSNQTKSGRAKPARTSKRTPSSKGTAKQSSPRNFPEPDPAKETPIPAELPDYEIGPSESHSPVHFLGNLVRDTRARILLAVLFLGLLAWMAAPPVYQRIKIYRAMQFLQQSEVALSEENAPKALSLMRRAILMAPNEENVFRKVRLFNASLGDPAALSSIQQLMLEKQASSEELLTLAKLALKTNNVLIAKSALEGLQEDRSTEKFILEMRLLELEGNQAAALDLARKELPTLPPEGAEKLLLATAEMTLKSDLAASQQILVQLVDNDSATGMTALRMLAAQQLFQPTQKSKQTDNLAEKILSHPLRTRDDELLALDLQILQNPASKPALLAQAASARTTAPTTEGLAFARWLNRRLSYKEAVDFIGLERARSNPDWFLVYLDALAGLERWNDIFSLLDENSIIGLSDSIRLLFLARAAEKSGDQERADNSWRDMQLGLAYEKPEVVSFVAAYALRIEERTQAIKAYTTLSNRKETALGGFLGLIRCWPSNTSAANLLPLYEQFTQAFPTLGEAQSDLTYLRLLTGDNPVRNAEAALKLHETSPSSLATLSIAALGQLKCGNAAAADELYSGKAIPWISAPAPWKAVRAAVLYGVGKNKEADDIVRTIKTGTLRPEELALLPQK